MHYSIIPHHSRGISVVEVILAAGLFVMFATGAIIALLGGLDMNRNGAENTVAAQYASEGIEAIRSIKKQNFSLLVTTAGIGVTRNVNGVWAFNGSNNTFEGFTRTLTVTDVYRDGSGNIVSNGGTLDPSTKKGTATVAWNFTSARPQTLTLSAYFSNWSSTKKGMLVFGNGGTTSDAIQYKTYDDSSASWTTAQSAADIDASTSNRYLRAVRIASSPTRDEKILVSRHYNGTTQYIYAQVFNGSTWGNVQLLSNWNATTFLGVQNFDATYMSNGNAVVVYSDNTVIPKYRTWNGSAWSGQANLTTLGTSQIPNYIVLKTRPLTNEIMAAFFTQGQDTITQYWNGSTWSAITTHSTAAQTNTKRTVDFAWSPNSPTKGAITYASSANNRRIAIKIWTADGLGYGSWTTESATGNQPSSIGSVSIAAQPNANAFIMCQKDANATPRILCYRSDMTPTILSPTNNTIASATDTGIQGSMDMGYESLAGSTAFAFYSDNTSTPKYKLYNVGTSTWDTAASSFSLSPYTPGVIKTTHIVPLDSSDDAMVLFTDANRAMYSIVWNGSLGSPYTTPAGKIINQHGSNGSAITDYWYDFVWDAN